MSKSRLVSRTEIKVAEAELFAEVLLALSPYDSRLCGFFDEDFNPLEWKIDNIGKRLTDSTECKQL